MATLAPLVAAAGAILGACASVAASWLVMDSERRTRYDTARAQAYSRLLARTHEVLAAEPERAGELVGGHLEAYYEACVLATGPVVGSAAILHELVREHVLGKHTHKELEGEAIGGFVRAAQEELGVGERRRRAGIRWSGTHRVLRLPRR